MNNTSLIIVVPVVIAILVAVGVFLSFFTVWIKALTNGAPVGLFSLVGMRLGGVPYGLVVQARITAVKAGIEVSTDKIAAHYLAGGNVLPTVQALIAAQKAGIELNWDRACAIDLETKGSNKSVVEAVRTSVDPKVIDCPNPESGRATIDGVAKDGIQVKVKARVTVRTHLDRFVGGAKEETIIARVGEGIVKAIGSAEHHTDVLANPNLISQAVLKNSLDAQTMYEIVSIDVAEIDVGANVGANLQADQAAANLRLAQADAEKRRAMAVAMGVVTMRAATMTGLVVVGPVMTIMAAMLVAMIAVPGLAGAEQQSDQRSAPAAHRYRPPVYRQSPLSTNAAQ